jgi:hypothetical protein
MKLLKILSILVGIIACGIAATAAPNSEEPYIGYAYPAGGEAGTTVQVTVAGQRLRQIDEVTFSGNGVHGKFVQALSLTGPQKATLREMIQQIREARAKLRGDNGREKPNRTQTVTTTGTASQNASRLTAPLPDWPDLKNLDQQTPKQLQRVYEKYLDNKTIPKPPIQEEALLEITIDPGATPGKHELRLKTALGLTNPIVFQVGQIPEINKQTQDEAETGPMLPVRAPVVLNGRIGPGGVDHFPLELMGGQKLVVAVQARGLIPYLADAVPGWFQPVVALYDENGKELAYGNECGYDIDPAFLVTIPHDGKYTLEIRDALYRGRNDFVYRINIADESLVGTLIPTGSRGGVPIGSRFSAQPLSGQVQAYLNSGNSLPITHEVEPNDTGKTANPITMPHLVDGCISHPGDVDVFRIHGKAGETVVAEVYARRFGSPLDSLLRLIDANGKVVAWNDDYPDKESGLLTQHVDSYLSAKLPATGDYFVQVSDAQRHSGPEYNYCLRISPPRPDFALRLTPSTLNVAAGRAVGVTVYALRKDGWDGDIDISLKNAPAGFMLSGARIPKGLDHVTMTLVTAPRSTVTGQPVTLNLEGRAQIDGNTVVRPVIPANDMEQAFAYHHLVPADELVAFVTRVGRIMPSLDIPNGDHLRIPSGGTVTVSMRLPVRGMQFHFELSDPPAGVTLQDVTRTETGYSLTFKADDKHAGYRDNLIVEGFTENAPARAGAPAAKQQRTSLGILPAIPFEIITAGGSRE